MTQVKETDAANLVCVRLEVHIWGGRRHLVKEDLIQANEEFKKLPSEKLATLGAYKICNPEDIKKFNSIKGRAERVLKRNGLPILGAWGIPDTKYQAVHAELVGIQREFEELKLAFVSGYDKAVAAWKLEQLIENPEYAHLFNDVPTQSHVANRLSFAFHPCKISPPAAIGDAELNERFDEQVSGLKGQLMKEVSEEASVLITDYLTTKGAGGVVKQREYVTPKTLGPLKRAAMKLESFRFLDPSIGPLAAMINELVGSLPAERIEGPGLLKVWSLARMLSTPSQALKMATMAMEGASADDVIAGSGIATTSASTAPATAALANAESAPARAGVDNDTPRPAEALVSTDLAMLI